MGLLTAQPLPSYTFMASPSPIADRSTGELIAALAVWSLFTALQGFAQNLSSPFCIGVGVGQGCSLRLIPCWPITIRRASRDGAGHLCPCISSAPLASSSGAGWRNSSVGWAFVVVGVPGLLLAVLVRFTVKEPPRGMSETIQPAADAPPAVQPPVKEVIAYLLARRSFIHMAIGGGVTAFVGYGLITFAAAFFTRSHGMSSGELGTYLGLIFGIPGGIGIALGGALRTTLGPGIRAGICGWCPLGC